MTVDRRLEAARRAVHRYHEARRMADRANPYQDASLGRTDAMRALDAAERAYSEALDELRALPGLDEGVARHARTGDVDAADDSLDALEMLLISGGMQDLLGEPCMWESDQSDSYGDDD